MLDAANELEFERAAAIRDRIEKMRDSIGEPVEEVKAAMSKSGGRGKRRGRVPKPKRNV